PTVRTGPSPGSRGEPLRHRSTRLMRGADGSDAQPLGSFRVVVDKVGCVDELPRDPVADDPADPAEALGGFDDGEPLLTPAERDEAITDLADVEVFRSLLEPRGVRGL